MKYSLKKLWKNFNFLMKYNLEDVKIDILDEVEDMYVHKEYYDKGLKILNSDETVDLLLKKPKSFCRFGDGEALLMQGKDIPFQKYDKKLAEMMLEILRESNNELYVGISYGLFSYSKNSASEFNNRWGKLKAKKYRDFWVANCTHNRIYIDASFNQKFVTAKNYDFDTYYKKIKQLFVNRDMVIFAGKGVLDKLTYDVFELSKSKEIILGPSKNAFTEIDALYEKAMSIDSNKTLAFILGPCSKVLVAMLAKQGRIAFDIGHLAKDYDFYMKGTEKSSDNIREFYRPD